MGILVDGAQKVEEGAHYLNTNLQDITQETRARAEPSLRATWKHARRSLESKEGQLRPVRRKVEDLRDQLSHRTAMSIDKAETLAKLALKQMIENTIDELEKVKRSLERDSERIWHAA